MIFDLIGIPFLKAGNNDTPFVVYQNDFKEILMKQPIAIRFAETEKMLQISREMLRMSNSRIAFNSAIIEPCFKAGFGNTVSAAYLEPAEFVLLQ